MNHEWVKFILNVPTQYSYRQVLYRKIQRSYWPHLFNNWNSPFRDSSRLESLKWRGRIRAYIRKSFTTFGVNVGANKSVNYIDWNYALIYQTDFKDVVYSNLQDLRARKIIDWVDIERLWLNNQKTKRMALELMILAALEVHLKARTIVLQ